MTIDGIKPTPPYVPFKTFISAIEPLEQQIPERLDRTVWTDKNSWTISQILIAFRFFGLADHKNRPLPGLAKLVLDKTNRKNTFRSIFENCYQPITSHNLSTITINQIYEAIQKYGISGSTLKKAVSFFLAAADYAEMPLSPDLHRKMRSNSPSQLKLETIIKPATPSKSSNAENTSPQTAKNGTSKKIILKSGGTLELSISVDIFSMDIKDREFVFGLIDKLHNYEQNLSGEG